MRSETVRVTLTFSFPVGVIRLGIGLLLLVGESELTGEVYPLPAAESSGQVELLQQMAEAGELPVRLFVMLSAGNQELAEKIPGHRFGRALVEFARDNWRNRHGFDHLCDRRRRLYRLEHLQGTRFTGLICESC